MKKNKVFYYFIILLVVSFILLVLDIIDITKFIKLSIHYDWLGYLGAIIGSSFGMIGIYFTINETNKNFYKDTVNKVRPYFYCELLRSEFKNILFDFDDEEPNLNNKYINSKLRNIFFRINIDTIDVYNDKLLTNRDREIIENNGSYGVTDTDGVTSIKSTCFYHYPLELCNVGVGAAVNLRIAFYNMKTDKDDIKYIYPQSINVGEKIFVCIYCTCLDQIENDEKYCLEFIYDDIYGNKYIQKKEIYIEKNLSSDNKGTYISIGNDFSQNNYK